MGLATPDMVVDVFSPPQVEPGPPVGTHHHLFLSRSAHDISPIIVHAGEVLMWNGAYEMEVVKGDSMGGDMEVTWALGAALPPTSPAPAWQLLHAAPGWKRTKESKKGTRTVTSLCECEVCIVFYLVLARSSREVRDTVLRIRTSFRFGQACSPSNFARSLREFRRNSCTIPLVILRSNGTRSPCGHARPQAIPPGRQPGRAHLLLVHSRATR